MLTQEGPILCSEGFAPSLSTDEGLCTQVPPALGRWARPTPSRACPAYTP